jgi:ketosteroid isomerase-like protein
MFRYADERRLMASTIAPTRELASEPEDLARLFVERVNAGDAEGIAELYEHDAILGFPPGRATVGRQAIRSVFEQFLALPQRSRSELEEALPTLRHGDLALTGTRPTDNTGGRAQVARRQADGTWLRIVDRPESR